MRLKPRTVGLAAVGIIAFLGLAPAEAIVGTSAHPFDDLLSFTPVASQYAGFSYSPGALTYCYGPWGYPPAPESPRCRFFDRTGVTTITVTDPLHYFLNVRGWCATAAPFANPNGISIELTDIAGESARTSCKSNYGYGNHFELKGTGLPAGQLVIHDTGNYWIADHLVFGSLV